MVSYNLTVVKLNFPAQQKAVLIYISVCIVVVLLYLFYIRNL